MSIKAYMVGGNLITGTVEATATKLVRIDFGKTFAKKPSFSFILGDAGASYTPNRKKTYTDCALVQFKATYTGSIDWMATENA